MTLSENLGYNWTFPILGLLFGSGCFMLYVTIEPGFQKTMSEVPDGEILNVVPPTIYIAMGIVAILIGICLGYLQEIEK